MSAIQYSHGELMSVPDDCPDCDEPLYDSGCMAPGCTGMGCQECGWGCDVDFVDGDESRCAQALAAEDPADRDARVSEERAFWGLSND